MIGIASAKILATPFEVCQTLMQVHPEWKSGTSIFKRVLEYGATNSNNWYLFWTGLLVDLARVAPSIMTENVVYSGLKILKSKWSVSRSFPSRESSKKERLKLGFIAKFAALIVTYPLALIRTRLILNQFHTPSLDTSLKGSLKDSFLFHFGSGMPVAIIKMGLYILIKEAAFRKLKKKTEQHTPAVFANDYARDSSHLSAAIMLDYISGAIAESLLFPLILIIRKLQTKNGGLLKCINQIWKKEGLRGFFSGFKYHLMDVLLIYFGTMLFYTLSRFMIKTANMLFSSDDSSSKPKQQAEDK